MEGDAISRYDAHVQMRRLKDKTLQMRKSGYRDGWNDAIESADQALNNCKALDVTTVVCCRNCLNAAERESTLVYCPIQKKYKNPDAYCDEGIQIEE